MRYAIGLVIFLLISGCTGGGDEPPTAEIEKATSEINSANTPAVQRYAGEQLKSAQEALNTAKSLVTEKKNKDALVNAIKAQVYAKAATMIAEVKSASETSVDSAKKNESKAKAAEAQARAEIEIVKASLLKAKEIIPTLRDEINKILKDLEDAFDFDKIKEKAKPKPSS